MSDEPAPPGLPDFVEPDDPAWDDEALAPSAEPPDREPSWTRVAPVVPLVAQQPPITASDEQSERMAAGLALMYAGLVAGVLAFVLVELPLIRTVVFGVVVWGMVTLYRLGAGTCRRAAPAIAATLTVVTVLFWLGGGLWDWWQFTSGLPLDDRWTMALRGAFSPGALGGRLGTLLVMAALALGSWFVRVRGVLRHEAGR